MSPSASQTWHQRLPNFEEERRYFRLIATHQLTQRWLREIAPGADESGHLLERTSRPELAQNLWLLEKVKLDELPPRLEEMIDASKVDEFIAELDETVWIVQSSTLENMLSHSTDRISLLNVLEKASWQTGKAQAEAKWENFRADQLLSCYEAIERSPIGGKGAFVLEKHHETECSFYWVRSPLNHPALSRTPEVLHHCQLYHEWIRGFIYGLSRNVRVTIVPAQLGSHRVWKITLSSY